MPRRVLKKQGINSLNKKKKKEEVFSNIFYLFVIAVKIYYAYELGWFNYQADQINSKYHHQITNNDFHTYLLVK